MSLMILLQNACKVMAKDLVRTRRYVQKFYQMRTQLQAVGLRIQTLRSNQQMADAMKGATRVCYHLHAHMHRTSRPNAMLGNVIYEPWAQSTSNIKDHERIRKGEFNDGHEGRNDV